MVDIEERGKERKPAEDLAFLRVRDARRGGYVKNATYRLRSIIRCGRFRSSPLAEGSKDEVPFCASRYRLCGGEGSKKS